MEYTKELIVEEMKVFTLKSNDLLEQLNSLIVQYIPEPSKNMAIMIQEDKICILLNHEGLLKSDKYSSKGV